MVKYLTAEEILAAHAEIIDRYGGSHGLRDLSLLESAVARPRAGYGDFEAYATLWGKAAALLQSLVLNHPFVDGNKRTGVVASLLFVERNGYVIDVSQRVLVQLALRVASQKLDHAAIARWLETHSIPAA